MDSVGVFLSWEAVMLLTEILDEVPDPRGYNAVHDLTDVLFVALAAVLCGAVHCTEMAFFAKTRLELLRQFVPLERGAPSHDTFTRVLGALDPQAFQVAFGRFMAAFGAQARADTGGQVAVDGKSLRRAYDKGRAHMPPLVVTAFDCDTFMSLSQVVAQAGGEAAAAIAALNLLSLKGCTVTADALHCHRRMTRAVRDNGGHYVLAIKGNQASLAREAKAALDKAAATAPIGETEDQAHGRHEVRRAIVTRFAQTPGKNALIDLVAVARVESWRTQGGKTTHKTRDYALSRRMTPAEVLRTVRRHWAIENDLHWQLDVLMAEDQARNRKNNGPANLAALRRLALNVLRSDPENIPLSHKRLKARWANEDLLKLMTHMR
jgi:predicted transposase YbfD/YdcC